MLTGQAKTDYQREYMRRRRSNVLDPVRPTVRPVETKPVRPSRPDVRPGFNSKPFTPVPKPGGR